jgi:hypothetical protein
LERKAPRSWNLPEPWPTDGNGETVDEHTISPAGDPFTAAKIGRVPDSEEHPHACNDGWVSMEVEAEDGTLEEVLYLCRRCMEAEEGASL